jgi:hypothetical protein
MTGEIEPSRSWPRRPGRALGRAVGGQYIALRYCSAPVYERRKTRVREPRYTIRGHYILQLSLGSRGVSLKPSILKAVFTDGQFWIPAAVLALGIALLAYIR